MICGLITAGLAGSKERNRVLWFFVGLCLGIVGIIIITCVARAEGPERQQALGAQQSRTVPGNHTRTVEILADYVARPTGKYPKGYPTYDVYLVIGSPTWRSHDSGWLISKLTYDGMCTIPAQDVEKVKMWTGRRRDPLTQKVFWGLPKQ